MRSRKSPVLVLATAAILIPATLMPGAEDYKPAKAGIHASTTIAPVKAGSISGKPAAGSMTLGHPSAGSMPVGKPAAGSLATSTGAGSLAPIVGTKVVDPGYTSRQREIKSDDTSSSRTTRTRKPRVRRVKRYD